MFNLQTKLLESLLGDAQSFYRIPEYQRPYSWEDEQVEQLLDDLYEAWDKGRINNSQESSYFLGSIVLVEPDINATEERQKYFDVIDGQQRLITLIIMSCVIRDLVNSKEIEIDKSILNLDAEDFNNFVKKKDDNRLTIMSHSQEYLDLFKPIIDGSYNNSNNVLTKKEKKENKFLNTAQICANFFAGEDNKFSNNKKDISYFIKYVLSNIRVVVIICDERSEAIQIFKTLNARGMDLSTENLIRSHLFSYIEGSNEEFEIENLTKGWDNLSNEIRDINDDINLENMLLYYAYFLAKGDIKYNLYESLTNNESPFNTQAKADALAAFGNFSEFAKCYIPIANDKNVFFLKKLRQKIYWRTILIAAAYNNDINNKWDVLAFDIMRFYYLYWISGHTISKIKQTSFNIITAVSKGENIENIKAIMDKKIADDNIIQKVWSNIRDHDVYHTPWCKYLLIAIEMNQFDEIGFFDYTHNSKIHIEHITPQNYQNNKQHWEGLTGLDNKVHSLANLTLLSGKKNIAASDKPFAQKLSENYLDNNGKGQDGITSLRMTQLLEKYSDAGWIDSSYEDRSKWMECQVSEILSIDIPE